jgi:hypothetical protein
MKTKAGNSEDSVDRSKLTMRFGKNAIDQALLAHLQGHGHTMSTELKRLAYMALTGGVNITPPDLISVATPVKQQGVQRTDIVERGNGGRFGSVPKQTVGAPGSESAISVAAPVTHPVMRREEQHNMEPVPQIEMVTLVKDDSQAENEPTIEYQGDQMVWTQEGSPTSSIPDNLGVKLLNF